MDEMDEKVLRLVQDGIMIVPRPFEVVGRRLGIGEDEVLKRIHGMIKSGVIRRFSASIGHRAIGILANGLCVWNVPDHRVEEVGRVMAGFEEVTHCYERPRRPGWQYNMYTMIHGYTRRECEEVARRISEAVGVRDYTILFSEREFKKTGVRV